MSFISGAVSGSLTLPGHISTSQNHPADPGNCMMEPGRPLRATYRRTLASRGTQTWPDAKGRGLFLS